MNRQKYGKNTKGDVRKG